jgi:hypothetical protein
MRTLITVERLKALLHYNPISGVFTWRMRRRGRWGIEPGVAAGSVKEHGYVYISLDCRLYHASRLAWLYVTGKWPIGVVDHKDANRQNNAWVNLRDVTQQINMQNKRTKSWSDSGEYGVWQYGSRGKWRAAVFVSRKPIHLGVFDTFEQAVVARRAGEQKYYSLPEV